MKTSEASLITRLDHGHLIAAALIIVTTVWMLTGSESAAEAPPARSLDQGLTQVEIRPLEQASRALWLDVSAKTQASRELNIASEVRGRVVKIHKSRGDWVDQGELLLTLDQRDWPERLKQAEAALEESRLAFESTQRLIGKGLANSADLAAAKSDLASAEAGYTDTSIQLAATRVRAPFAGLLNDRYVEIGDLVHDGTELFHLLDLNPYLVVAHLPEQQAKSVQVGQTANATLINGQSVSGTLRYLSVLADPNTRTFAAELAVPNPGQAPVPVGSTAKLRIPQGHSDVYHLSPSLLVIDLEGRLGVKAVNESDEVIFVPVSLYESDASGLWVQGLAPGTRLITRGAGFVAEGERVKPMVSADNGGR